MNRLTTNQFTILFLSFAIILLFELAFFNGGELFLLILAAGFLYFAYTQKQKYTLILGLFFLLLAVLSLWTLRLIPILLISYVLYKYLKTEPQPTPIKPKPQKTFGTVKNTLIDAFETDKEYKWQDLQLQKLAGTITIDTTETILPTGRSFIAINQAFGKTTILVPYEVTIELHYSTLYGEATILHAPPQRLINEKLAVKEGVEDAKRSLVIYVASCFSDLEVQRR